MSSRASLLREAIETYLVQGKGIKLQAKQAKELGLKPTLLSSYLNGSAPIPDARLEDLANRLIPTADGRKQWIAQMKQARQKTGPEIGKLRIASFPRPPLSGDPHALLEGLFRHLGARGNLETTPWEERRFVFGGLPYPAASDVDVILGLAERFDLDYLTDYQYWRTPIKVSIAILGRRDLTVLEKKQILDAFTGNKISVDQPVLVVHVLRESIAVRYARQQIGGMEASGRARIEEWLLDVEPGTGRSGKDLYKSILSKICKQMESKQSENRDSLHVLLLDELTAYSVVEASDGNLQPLFPITWLKNAQQHKVRREAPKHRITFAISKKQSGLSDNIVEFLNQVIAVEPETTSRAFAKAAIGTLKMVRGNFEFIEDLSFFADEVVAVANAEYASIYRSALRWRAALLYTRHMFSIDEISLRTRAKTDVWYRIMERTRELFDEELATLPFSVREFENSSAPETTLLNGVVLAAFQLEGDHFEIQDRGMELLLDTLELSEQNREQLIRICIRRSAMTFVLLQLEAWLKNHSVDGEIANQVEFWSSPDDADNNGRFPIQARVVGEMLRSLQAMYERIPADGFLAVERIEADLRDKLHLYRDQEGGFVSLAYLNVRPLDEETRPYIGMLCVSRANLQKAEDYAEFRYLWVDPIFRRRGVAKLLLEKTLQKIRDEKFAKYVFLELLPSLAEAKMEFLSMGFRYLSRPEALEKMPGFQPTAGRLLFLLEIANLDEEKQRTEENYILKKQMGSWRYPSISE